MYPVACLTPSEEKEDTLAACTEWTDVANDDDDDVMLLQYFNISASANMQASHRLALITNTDQVSESNSGSAAEEIWDRTG